MKCKLKIKGKINVKCPKCGYIWKTKQEGYICCSKCKRYFRRFK